MQEIKYPYFKKGRILKIEMLENMRDYPRDVVEIYNDALSDGIVCGLVPKVDQDIITFSKGIVKYQGQVYLLNHPTSIPYQETHEEVMIKLNFYDEIRNNDYHTQFVEIEIDPKLHISENQMELGRFKLKKGAYLRSDYQDLYDFTTEYNTINIVQVLYAGYQKPTLSNLILKYFARAALETYTQNQMDITFCLFCLNNERVEREVVCRYICYKLEEKIDTINNNEIHKKLVLILDQIKKENLGLRRKKSREQKIILD